MPLFQRRESDPPPPWAGGVDAGLYAAFLGNLRDELHGRRLDAEIDESAGCIVTGELRYGLSNLIRLYARAPRRDRPAVVRSHLDAVLVVRAERDQAADGWERARRFLKVRIYPDSVPGLVARPVADGLVEALTLDLPTSVATVRAEELETWGQPLAELFRVGYENVDEEPPPDVEAIELADAGGLFAVTGASFYTATALRWVERVVPGVPAAGLLVSVPHRHALLGYPIHDSRVVEAVGRMVALTRQLHDRGPGALSENLYWWHAGELTRLPYRLAGDRLDFWPPDSFLALLRDLDAA